MLAYVGPESVAPVLSVIAAFVGFLLIGWRWIISQCKRVYRFVFRIKIDDVVEFGKDDSADPAQSDPQSDPQNDPQGLRKTGS